MKIGTGDICALITKSTMIIRNKKIGISQILLDFVERINNCLIDANIQSIVEF